MRTNPRMVRVPGLPDDGRAMVAQRFGVDMHRRRDQELTRFQWIQRPPGSTWDAGSPVHPRQTPPEGANKRTGRLAFRRSSCIFGVTLRFDVRIGEDTSEIGLTPSFFCRLSYYSAGSPALFWAVHPVAR